MTDSCDKPVEVQVMESIRDRIRELGLEGSPPVEVREDYHSGSTIYVGITVYDLGERYDDGVIGLEDVGYQIGVAMVWKKTTDSTLSVPRGQQWREPIRRRFQNMRLPVADEQLRDVKRHVCRVASGSPRHPRDFNKEHHVRLLTITVWAREQRDDGEEDA